MTTTTKKTRFRKQEKEQRKNEKEARKVEEKLAKQKEKEAAKLEKQYRHTISRSSERVTNRSGSLERRKSGDGEMVVLNQSTVHGKHFQFVQIDDKFLIKCF